ncbi:AraC family transcriptional regulator [Bacillus sp. DTU_2020_1000418_1_SI_GHA_SEK_038]|uniref:AraC family transcriptional regulator n=1 Tax=Bacillus sp. DTU_2020_1000418_1_SI_GHA_SEK_038 TaxID=3077585 RepID=UPI0028E2DB1E|nr:AraC family transcriptional regulator [Bacillus sp. DTU_2020_1000418_1_SI_GHA_SEK_038]WNS76256.1 AraC family transcriptional regulator [Bacillus sp. DTU_2020_1000418_1_SI_GHA_SEK_038]
MACKRKLNVLNGQEMYHFFKKTQRIQQEIMVPFNEAMCYGNTSANLFSDEFNAIRAQTHDVSSVKYHEITLEPLQPLLSKNFMHLALWFGPDMFCQINVLTILAWLDQTQCKKTIDLHLINDNYEHLEKFALEVNGYYDLYKQVLIDKTMPATIYPEPLMKGIELYLNYQNEDSVLMLYIKSNSNVPEKVLVYDLMRNFPEYGLGDIQYMELIRKCWNSI